MSGKYMKVRRIVIPTITMILIASQLFGCSAADQEQAYNMMQDSEAIELEIAEPLYATDEEISLLPWLQLASLETHPELRASFEEYVGVTGTAGNKEGILYYNPETESADQNVTLYMATRNTGFRNYFVMEDTMTTFGKMASENYVDVEPDDLKAPYATINAYFELLPDAEESQFDGDSSISRAQAMTLVMRATTPVNESQTLDTDEEFTTAVGDSTYTDFAAPMNEYSYINTSNGLNKKTFDSTMSRGEYICLITNFLRADFLKDIENKGYVDNYSDTSDVKISTVSDAGDISFSEAIADAAKGVPSDMYETFKVAIKNGYLSEDALEDWDSAITKADAIELFTSMALNYSGGAGYGLVNDYIEPSDQQEVNEGAEIMNSKWADINGAWDAIHQWTLYAQENGADYTSGWCWEYLHGSGAGDQPSYAVYMKEGDPLYGTVYHVGDYLPNGDQFCGVDNEFDIWLADEVIRMAKEDGHEVEEREDAVVIHLGD